jgi:vitamin B12 transporter
MNRKIFFVAACIISSPLLAQDTTYKSLDEVIFTASKFPQKQSATGKVVSVITQQQIQRSQGKDLAQLLNEQTGMSISGANSNPGKDKSIFLRGASSNYTIILLDGVPVIDPSGVAGAFDIRLVPLGEIERIEILKGSQSTLYGSNAIAGVINIITKKPSAGKIAASGILSYGSYNTFKGGATVSGKGKRIEYSAGYEYFDTDGISEAKDTTGTANFDKDGFTRNAVHAKIGINVTDNLLLSPYYRFSEFKGNYDDGPFADAPNKYTTSLLNTGILGSLKYEKGNVSMNYGYDYTQRFYNGLPFKGRFHHGEVYVNHNISGNVQLLAGLNYQSYNMPPSDTTNSLTSVYASLFFKPISSLHIEVGGRYNNHNKYGSNFTYSFNPSYLINEDVKLFANLSSGFRAPSISELFGPFGANPNLKPEKSTNIEAGLQTWFNDKSISVLLTYFNRSIKDLIAYDFATGYQNRDKQDDQGFEAELNYQPNEKLSFKAAYAFVTGETTQKIGNKDTTFNNLIRRPKHTINLYAGYQATQHFFVSAGLQSFSKRDDIFYNPANFYSPEPKVLDAYSLLNVYADYGFINNRLKIFLDVKNLLDKDDYYEVYGFSVQGLNVTGGVRFNLR